MASCRCLNKSTPIRQLLSSFRCRTFTYQACAPLSSYTTSLSNNLKQDSFTGNSRSIWKRNGWKNELDGSFKSITTSSSQFADYEIVNTPPFAESITEGDVRWEKGIGDTVSEDEVVGEIETDKTSIPVTASASGVIVELFVEDGEKVEKGDKLFKIQVGEAPAADALAVEPVVEREATPEPVAVKAPAPAAPVRAAIPTQPPSVPVRPSGPATVVKPTAPPPPPASQQQLHIQQTESKEAPSSLKGDRKETRVKMSRMRLRIAERLKDAQNINAMLTTFQEVDMSNIMDMRKQHKDNFLKSHGLKLGFMSAFTKACSYALQSMPVVNAVIEDGHIVYRDYIDISVAVATPKGLVVPVLRDVQHMNYLDIESGINALGEKARKGELAIEDMDGGTFTISNGGVFGSLMGTPIINPPQSAILGLHAINDKPVALNGQVVIRPMMYLALTYDHRLVDGREAVTFLRKVKSAVEDPRIILLNL